MTGTPELLPCPWCGDAESLTFNLDHEQGTKWAYVGCGCDVRGPEVRTQYQATGWEPEAAKEWNARAAPATITITRELMDAGKSRGGSWNKWQTMALGVPWPLKSGWRMSVIGNSISKADADKFIALKDAHLPPTPAQDNE